MSSFFIPQTVPIFGDSTLGTHPLLPCFNSSPCPQCPQPAVASDTRSPVLEDSEEPPRRSSANSAKDQEGSKRIWPTGSLPLYLLIYSDLFIGRSWSIMIYLLVDRLLSLSLSISPSLALDGPQPSNEDAKRNNRSVDLSWSIYLIWSDVILSCLLLSVYQSIFGKTCPFASTWICRKRCFPCYPSVRQFDTSRSPEGAVLTSYGICSTLPHSL